jgi:positive regulator of sigma E activity
MQLFASTVIAPYLSFLGMVLLVGLVTVLAVAPLALRETRRDRRARHESIPTYYGRLHFAH